MSWLSEKIGQGMNLPSSDWVTRKTQQGFPKESPRVSGYAQPQTSQDIDFSGATADDMDHIFTYVQDAKQKARQSVDDQIAEARRRQGLDTFGSMAKVLGQAINLGIGQRQFDKVEPSTKWDEVAQKLKEQGTQYEKAYDDMALTQAINEQVRRANARQANYNSYLQNQYKLGEQATKFAQDRALQAQKAKDNAELQRQKDASADARAKANNETSVRTASIRSQRASGGGGSNSDAVWGSISTKVNGVDGSITLRRKTNIQENEMRNFIEKYATPEQKQMLAKTPATDPVTGLQTGKMNDPQKKIADVFTMLVNEGKIPMSELQKIGYEFTPSSSQPSAPQQPSSTSAPWATNGASGSDAPDWSEGF